MGAGLLLVGACSSGGDAPDVDVTTTTVGGDGSAPATAAEDAEEEVVEAYLAAAAAMDEAGSIPDPDHEGVAATHTGPMLEVRRATLAELVEEGRVFRFPEDSRRRSVVASVRFDDIEDVLDTVPEGKELAVLEVCTVDDGERVDQETGEAVLGDALVTVWWTALMVREPGGLEAGRAS